MHERLGCVGASWEKIAAVVLTHTHGDHVSDHTIAALARRRIPLVCHEGHRCVLKGSAAFRLMDRIGLVRVYDERPWLGPGGIRLEPVAVPHDCRPTFGFRIEARSARRQPLHAIGYLADLGTWDDVHADAMVDVNLLAVEFNHDVEMQRRSGRPAYLIARNLGDGGHLSNDQGAGLVAAALARSRPGRIHALVLLHLSQDCNRPDLARDAAACALRQANRRAAIHIAEQATAGPTLTLAPRPIRMENSAYPRVERRRQAAPARSQTWLTLS
jgi:phosphoribosyl 1,2-cyclic phosphodiesterase